MAIREYFGKCYIFKKKYLGYQNTKTSIEIGIKFRDSWWDI